MVGNEVMKVLILDGYNLMHRARSGFSKGDNPVIYNFFRGLRPLIEKFSPDRVYFTLEGRPKKNEELLGEYKANREIDESHPKFEELQNFHRQKDLMIQLLKNCFPFTVIWHPDYEADDVIATICADYLPHRSEITVVSGDSDFIQLLQQHDHVKLYHPIKKLFISPPDYDYVEWKSLRGDATDNIPGVKGMGDKTAEKLMADPSALQKRMTDPEFAAIVERNRKLITLESNVAFAIKHHGQANWRLLEAVFNGLLFRSMTKPKTWAKYTATFDTIDKSKL